MNNKDIIRKKMFLAEDIDPFVLETIFKNNWLRIWIPKKYNGLDYTLLNGLETLQNLARIDGSLGFFVTLCSGANYFSRNIKPEVAKTIFQESSVCFGGSDFIGGTAEKIDNYYLINGKWTYTTGSTHLTHFSFNAQIIENGSPLINNQGKPVYLSFFLNADQVAIIRTWNAMGLVATATHDFEIKNQKISENHSFRYDNTFGEDVLDRVPFSLFTDFTLIVNYIGMAEHFVEESLKITKNKNQQTLYDYIESRKNFLYDKVKELERELLQNKSIEQSFIDEIHTFGEEFLKKLSQKLVITYSTLGIRASRTNEAINQIFRDFFTATQHKNFRKNNLKITTNLN